MERLHHRKNSVEEDEDKDNLLVVDQLKISQNSGRNNIQERSQTSMKREEGEEEQEEKLPKVEGDQEQDGDGKRQITLAMTRSGAINALSSRFLRDSDEAVHARKVLASEPFHHRPIEARIYSHLPFPIRQDWTQVKNAEELDKVENEYFEKWLDETYKGRRVELLSPFEHNLEVWRQLWRVLEKSHIIVLLADIRDPLLHIPVALQKYVTKTLRLPMLIVLTKCDLVSDEHASKWQKFLTQAFGQDGETKIICNSGKCQSTHGVGGYSARRKILHGRATQAQIAEMHRQSHFVLQSAIDLAKEHSPELTSVSIGMIGQPNTGKSSLVNSILGRHAVSVSRTCGHTKHWQTQLIKNEQGEIIATIIDSPGIIFPMAVDDEKQQDSVSPRAWFECAGLYPIAQIRETFSAIRFAGERIDMPRMYNLKLNVDDYGDVWSPYAFLGSLADKRGYTLQMGGGAPDMHRAGLETINDICDGIILICFPPPNLDEWKKRTQEEKPF
jgi:ribosome biogenesis GTPase A